MFRTRMIVAPTIASLMLAAFGGAASAQTVTLAPSDPDAPSRRVFVADLDLSQAAGAHVAIDRIHMAAVDVCGGQPSPLDLDRIEGFRACVQAAADGAVAQLRSPVATAMNARAAGPRG